MSGSRRKQLYKDWTNAFTDEFKKNVDFRKFKKIYAADKINYFWKAVEYSTQIDFLNFKLKEK